MITRSVEETKELGRLMARALEGGENLLLTGDLGAGKTAFVQGLAEELGVREPVKSPTYTYLREYELPHRSTRLAHFDLYRLPDRPTPAELRSIELPERLEDRDVITAIEWGEKVRPAADIPQWTIRFLVTDTERKIELPERLRKKLPR